MLRSVGSGCLFCSDANEKVSNQAGLQKCCGKKSRKAAVYGSRRNLTGVSIIAMANENSSLQRSMNCAYRH